MEIIDNRTSSNPTPGPTPEQITEIANAKPRGKNVLVKRLEQDTSSTILLVTNDKNVKCLVVSVGELVTDLASGDIVLIRRYSGSEIELGSQEFTILHAEDVLLKF